MWRNLAIHAIKSTSWSKIELDLLGINRICSTSCSLSPTLCASLYSKVWENWAVSHVDGEYILVQHFVEQFGIIYQNKQRLDLGLLHLCSDTPVCYIVCSSKNPETTHQGTVEFLAAFRKIKVCVCLQGVWVCVCVCVCVCLFAGTCLFLVLCVFLLVSEATKENSGCL